MATRPLYQPHAEHTVCGMRALPQRGQVECAGAASFQFAARRLRPFIFEVFFFGTAMTTNSGTLRAADLRAAPN